ncbi:MAG: hypothetical protein JKX84_02970 [Flavobacteriales bacterium]|nr:hypothetical protein [Flavobacteriales bacterium]
MAKGLKTGGRKKGTSNKLTTSIRETLTEVLNGYTIDGLKEDLNGLTPYERIKVTTNLYRLTLPPIKQEVTEGNGGFEPFVITGMRIIDSGNKDDI